MIFWYFFMAWWPEKGRPSALKSFLQSGSESALLKTASRALRSRERHPRHWWWQNLARAEASSGCSHNCSDHDGCTAEGTHYPRCGIAFLVIYVGSPFGLIGTRVGNVWFGTCRISFFQIRMSPARWEPPDLGPPGIALQNRHFEENVDKRKRLCRENFGMLDGTWRIGLLVEYQTWEKIGKP